MTWSDPSLRPTLGFLFGAALFAAQLSVVVHLGRRVFKRDRPDGRLGRLLTGLVLLLKVFGLAVGAYVGLVALDLPAVPLVVGAFVALASWAAWQVALGSQRRSLT